MTLTLVGLADPITTRRTLTYAVSGLITVAAPPTAYLPPFFVPVPPDETWGFVGVWTILRSGACTIAIQQNGTNVTGMTGLLVGTTKQFYQPSGSIDIVDSDMWAPVVTAINGAPDGLTVSFFFEQQLIYDADS